MKYLRVILIVLLLGCCTLWVASYWRINWVRSDGRLILGIWSGSFTIARFENDVGHSYGLNSNKHRNQSTYWWPAVLINPKYPTHVVLHGTFWLPTLLLALPLAISASPWARRRRRSKQGLCIRCGYDLSGTDHTLCPECGRDAATGDSA